MIKCIFSFFAPWFCYTGYWPFGLVLRSITSPELSCINSSFGEKRPLLPFGISKTIFFIHSLLLSISLSFKRLNKELNTNVRSIFFEMIRKRLQVKYRYFYILECDSREMKLIIPLVIYINSFWYSMSLLFPSIDKAHFISKPIWDMFNLKNHK